MNTSSMILPLKLIEIGEPDANAEFYIAKKMGSTPVFIRAHYDAHFHGAEEFHNGTKFILYGQKGTGKTALLRSMEYKLSDKYSTQFVVFRKEILEEAELAKVAIGSDASIMVDEHKIKEAKFFYHAMKRLFLSLLLSKCNELESPPQSEGWMQNLLNGVKNSSAGEVATYVADSIFAVISSANINVNNLSKGVVNLDAGKIIKKSNDAFSKYCYSQLKKANLKCKIFFDEMHFAYMDKSTLSADAALVRDTLLALREVNEKLIDLEIDCTIYMSIRSEFLQHQEIATADIMQTIQSYGREISWENYDYNLSHPIFDMMTSRLKISLGSGFEKKTMFLRFLAKVDPARFLEYTWGKPRDIVRFFKNSKDLFHNKNSLSKDDFDSVLKSYSNMSWLEMKSALTAFMPKESIPVLESSLRSLAKRTLDGSATSDTKTDIIKIIEPAYTDMKKNGVVYSIDELFTLLYIVGVFHMSYFDKNNQLIKHSFHRGNRQPSDGSNVHLHYAIAKAFS